jgi:hypothetical protein
MDGVAATPVSKLHPADTAEPAHENVAPELEAVLAQEGVAAQQHFVIERDQRLIGIKTSGRRCSERSRRRQHLD